MTMETNNNNNNNKTSNNWTDIFHAAQHNDLNGVKRFVEVEKVAANSANERNETAAHLGAKNGNLDVVRYLVEQDSSLLSMKDMYGNSCLHLAVENGTMPLIVYLFTNRRMDVYEPNELNFGCTPLHIAAEHGNMKVLEYFVNYLRADVNVRNKLGEPPLFLATEQNQFKTVKFLERQLRANMTMTDYDGNNVLFACAKVGALAIFKYLVKDRQIPIDLNAQNVYGLTISNLATKYSHDDFVTYVVGRRYTNVSIADNEGRTPLHEAAMQDKYHMARYLYRHGGDLKARDNTGKIALDYATSIPVQVYLRNAAKSPYRPRLDRSVSADQYYLNFRGNCPVRSSSVESLLDFPGGESTTSDQNYFVSHLDNFFTLATICFRYQRAMYDSLVLSLHSSIAPTIRIDPFVFDSINDIYNDFGER